MKYFLFSILFALTSCGHSVAPDDTDGSDRPTETTIFLVRHAEKETGQNPPLTEAGNQRANDLADRLKEDNITEIFSTDYRRTQLTAQPTAVQFNRGVGSYNPKNLKNFAKKLKNRANGNILVVGHSNTTPELVELLGGEPGTPIVEAWEYDRLYKLILKKGKLVSSELLRYGVSSKETSDF